MNIALAQGLLTGGGKVVAVLQGILEEVSPAIATLGPDVAQLVADANKTLADFQAIFEKLKSIVASAGSTAAIPAPVVPPAA